MSHLSRLSRLGNPLSRGKRKAQRPNSWTARDAPRVCWRNLKSMRNKCRYRVVTPPKPQKPCEHCDVALVTFVTAWKSIVAGEKKSPTSKLLDGTRCAPRLLA